MKTVIGLEIHNQLASESKLFCACPTKGYRTAPANSLICPSCLSQPGSKPWGINAKAVGNVLKIALALNCKIILDKPVFVQRKHYIYPDLASGYQRTSKPIGENGELAGVKIREVHVEEDPGQYDLRTGEVNYNRSGVPLVEIVTDPDFTSADHARRFLEELSAILDYLGARRSEPGSMRVDANISIEGHPRIEVKNINSFKGVLTALTFEEARQKNLVKHGAQYGQETRHFDEKRGITIGLRKKESVDDYRYFPDPDVPPMVIGEKLVEKIRRGLPELPAQKRERFVRHYNVTGEEAFAICLEKEYADAFEEIAKDGGAKQAANFMRGVVKKQLNYRDLAYRDSKLTVKTISELLAMLEKKEITEKVAEKLLIDFLDKGLDPRKNAEKEGLLGIHGSQELEAIVERVISENKKPVEDFRKGKAEALHFLAGQVMKLTKGKASPREVREMLEKRLK
ncbi:Asp-tRNA(Asn)/Glu-tRNA(Gln) amidotransferase subunit GatB [Candidatus Micrarchaeota archaeon]|nr:Asp-tRNA(Asn)/Glu-tRNA(Gln) amidotransferase subunit GatB [Candidatus Micrarchaeota archaeon]